MCGIGGIYAFEGKDAEADTGRRMSAVLSHRGPDGDGLWRAADGQVCLVHRRLSILDLSSAAAQPMATPDGRWHIVFNGEIYNHRELREELKELGRTAWQTDHSDTEVILQAFDQWGIDAVPRLRGMFAIAIHDARSRDLWLVRDRVGIKPLYYAVHEGRLLFASEIKAILQVPGFRRAVDEDALFHYLSFLATPAPQTLFQGVSKVAAATWIHWRPDGTHEERRYWDPLDAAPVQGNEDQVAARLRQELRTSVRLHKESDVPVGVFLSGGIDSTTNAALFSEGGAEVRTFTIGYVGDYKTYQNEVDYARRAAESIGARHHERLLTQEDLISFLPRMIHLQDEPIADPVCVPVYYVSELARQNGVTVCQVGEGADELFWGYPTWRLKLKAQRLADTPGTKPLQRLAKVALRLAGRDKGPIYEALRRSTAGQPVFWGGAEAFSDTEKQKVLSARMRRRFAGRTSWEALAPIRQRFLAKASRKQRLLWMSYLDLNLRLPELLLMRVDKMGMGVSLEARVPFLDHHIIELAFGIPESMKTKGGNLKHILKKAVRGLIPDEIIDRPKQGFGVPVHEWVFDRLGEQARRDLGEFCDQTDFLDKAEVMRLFDEKRHTQVWYLLNLALWWKEYIAAPEPPGPVPLAAAVTARQSTPARRPPARRGGAAR